MAAAEQQPDPPDSLFNHKVPAWALFCRACGNLCGYGEGARAEGEVVFEALCDSCSGGLGVLVTAKTTKEASKAPQQPQKEPNKWIRDGEDPLVARERE